MIGAEEPDVQAGMFGYWHLLPAWLPDWHGKAVDQLPALFLEDRAPQRWRSSCGGAGLSAEGQGCKGWPLLMPEIQLTACTGHAQAVAASSGGRG